MCDVGNGARRHGLSFFKQKPAYEMRISDWSSDVCSSDLRLFLKQRNALELEKVLHKTKGIPLFQEQAMKMAIRTRTTMTMRSEERRVGKESVSTCRSRWSLCHENTIKMSSTDAIL